jgi:hypothetical protein
MRRRRNDDTFASDTLTRTKIGPSPACGMIIEFNRPRWFWLREPMAVAILYECLPPKTIDR